MVIGAGAVVVGRITIGNNAFIGANAYVYQDIPENAVVGAMPGKILSYNGTKGYFGALMLVIYLLWRLVLS